MQLLWLSLAVSVEVSLGTKMAQLRDSVGTHIVLTLLHRCTFCFLCHRVVLCTGSFFQRIRVGSSVVLSSQKSFSVLHCNGAMESRIEEPESRRAAINDKLSGVVNQFNDDKQKFKDETEFEFAQHTLVLHEVVGGARKEFEGLRQSIHGLRVGTGNTVTNLQQRVVHQQSNSSEAYNNKGYLSQKSMIPKSFTDKEELAGGSCRLRGHNDPRDRPGDGRH